MPTKKQLLAEKRAEAVATLVVDCDTLFHAADLNGDGELSKAELSGFIMHRKREATALCSMIGGAVHTKNFFEALDKNSDGKITLEEWREAVNAAAASSVLELHELSQVGERFRQSHSIDRPSRANDWDPSYKLEAAVNYAIASDNLIAMARAVAPSAKLKPTHTRNSRGQKKGKSRPYLKGEIGQAIKAADNSMLLNSNLIQFAKVACPKVDLRPIVFRKTNWLTCADNSVIILTNLKFIVAEMTPEVKLGPASFSSDDVIKSAQNAWAINANLLLFARTLRPNLIVHPEEDNSCCVIM